MKNTRDIKLLLDRCHDRNGEIYYVNFTHDRMSITSYPDDEIPAKVDTRADTVTAFA
ncbi:MAG: hypothetical protein PHF57_13470 [Methanoregula sp.]|jgi:hypothetical protein|nr:hypothetical protein [Methanoregula sp.]MDD5189208.1 hypothetical protein [Methanoregula sp.]